MDFENFVNEVADCIPEYLLQYDIDNIHIETISKNNGVSCTGMAICLKGESITPNVYLEYFYNLYKGGKNMEDVLCLIRDEFNQAYDNLKDKKYTDLSKENLRDCLFLKLVNYEKNKELLEDCPYVAFFDLAIVFRFLVRKDEDGIASAMIKNKDMEAWNMTVEELYEMGKKNTLRLFKPSLNSLKSVLNKMFDGMVKNDSYSLQVLTNETGVNGAIYMTYEDLLRKYADEIQRDLYILPSSIHEVLLMPYTDELSKEELSGMVRDINEYVVDDMDFLSDEVYFFSREKGFNME